MHLLSILPFYVAYFWVCPQSVLYDVLKLKILGVHAPESQQLDDCDQSWRSRITSGHAAFGSSKAFANPCFRKQSAILANFMIFVPIKSVIEFMQSFTDNQITFSQFLHFVTRCSTFSPSFCIFFIRCSSRNNSNVLSQFGISQYNSFNVQSWSKFQSEDNFTRND